MRSELKLVSLNSRTEQDPSQTHDLTIPLTGDFFDHPKKFVSIRWESISRAVNQHRIFFWEGYSVIDNYAQKPNNIEFDGSSVLMLYSEFGEPKKGSSAQGLAVCSFDTRLVDDTNAYTLDIVQFQTALFGGEEETKKGLSYINFKDLFTHVIEQVGVWIHEVKKIPVGAISIRKEWSSDIIAADRHIHQDLSHLTQVQVKVLINEEKNKIIAARAKWAHNHGFTKSIQTVRMSYGEFYSPHESWAKPLNHIEPDRKLQTHLYSIFE